MKYVMIIPSGISDGPVDELDGLTPMQAADMPNLSRLAGCGRLGTVETIPDGLAATPETGLLTLLGYEAEEISSGRAGFTAIPLQVELDENDWAISLAFVTVDPETNHLIHPTAGAIEPTEARLLLESLSEVIGEELGESAADLEFFTGHGGEYLLVDRSGQHRYDDLITMSPSDCVGKSIRKFVPHGGIVSRGESKESARLLNTIMEISRRIFAEHEVNKTRRELGDPIASQVWLWGAGKRAELVPFKKRFPGLRCAMVTMDDLAGGIAVAAGWDRLDVYDKAERVAIDDAADPDKASEIMMSLTTRRAERAIRSGEYDLITIYINAGGEVSFEGDFAGKIAILELIDREVVGPVSSALREVAGGESGLWRLFVVPEVCLLTQERRRDSRPVGFIIAGAHVQSVVHFDAFNEATAEEADLHIESGSDFLEYALYSGMPMRK